VFKCTKNKNKNKVKNEIILEISYRSWEKAHEAICLSCLQMNSVGYEYDIRFRDEGNNCFVLGNTRIIIVVVTMGYTIKLRNSGSEGDLCERFRRYKQFESSLQALVASAFMRELSDYV